MSDEKICPVTNYYEAFDALEAAKERFQQAEKDVQLYAYRNIGGGLPTALVGVDGRALKITLTVGYGNWTDNKVERVYYQQVNLEKDKLEGQRR